MDERNTRYLPVPIKCDKCFSPQIQLKNEAEIYDKQRRDWPWVWHCNSCGAMVGCHVGTDKPLGYMANRAVRQKRSELHLLLDPLWKCQIFDRSLLYDGLAELLKIKPSICHISTLALHQLNTAIAATQILYNENARAIKQFERKQRADAKRKEDRNARRNKRRKRNIRPID